MELTGKRALVTGASRGIGLAVAKALANRGARVFITARDEKSLAETAKTGGLEIGYESADLAVADEIKSIFARAIKFLGGIDILVNNAGVGIYSPFVDLPEDSQEQMIAINLRAPMLLSRLAAKEMKAQKHGYIINIGSGASQSPTANYAVYCATKYGLLGFSESLALELRDDNIKVSIILPGSTATYFGGGTPEGRLAAKPGILRPEDVADTVIYLLGQKPQAWTSVVNLRPLHPEK